MPFHALASRFSNDLAVDLGGAMLKGLESLIRQETNLPVTLTDDPLSSVVRGTAQVLGELNPLRQVAILSLRRGSSSRLQVEIQFGLGSLQQLRQCQD